MANIVPYDDTPIIDEEALAKKHFELVENLKQNLFVGNAGWIKAGQYLSEIKNKKTYTAEDASNLTTWPEFIQRPDLPIGGSSPDGRMRTAQKLMTVWNNVASQPGVDKKVLAEIGYSKLALVAGVISKDPSAKLGDWLEKAKTLSHADLQTEIGDGGKTISEVNDCMHDNIEEVDAFRCSDCKKFFKKDPRIKKKKDEEKD